MRSRSMPSAALALSVTLLATACGGGDLGDEAPFGPPTADAAMLLPFVTAAGELTLLDPADPAVSPAPADTGLGVPTVMRRVLAGTYNSATNDLGDAHYRHLVYVKNGQVWRADLQKGGSAPVRVSSLADVCALVSLSDHYANPLARWLEVERRGGDGQCTGLDNVRTHVRLSTGATAGGFTPAGPFRILMTVLGTGGEALAHLVQQGASSAPSLQVYSDAFVAQGGTVALEAGTTVRAGNAVSRTRRYFRMRLGTDNNEKLYRYDASTGALTALHGYTASSTAATLVGDADDAYLYFADGHRLLRVAHTASAANSAEVLHTPSATLTITDLRRSASRLVLQIFNANTGNSGLYSFPQAAVTSPSEIVTLEAETDPASLAVFAVAGARVHYTMGGNAVRVQESGSGRLAVSGHWSGALFRPGFDLGGLNAQLDVAAVVLGRADGSFAAVNAAVTELGSISSAVSGRGLNIGRYLLSTVDVGTSDDVWFADVEIANSLVGVAIAPGDDAAP